MAKGRNAGPGKGYCSAITYEYIVWRVVQRMRGRIQRSRHLGGIWWASLSRNQLNSLGDLSNMSPGGPGGPGGDFSCRLPTLNSGTNLEHPTPIR